MDPVKSWLETDWPAPPHIRAGTSTRTAGVSKGKYSGMNLAMHVGDDEACVLENRHRLQSLLSLPCEPVWLNQVHGNTVISLDNPGTNDLTADGSNTVEHKKVCAVLTADCVPLLMCDKQGSRIAAVHAGWRGITKGIIETSVQHFSDPESMLVWIGPCIDNENYIVGEDVVTACADLEPATGSAFLQTDHNQWQCDLDAIVRTLLQRQGVRQIYSSELSTYKDDSRFYSYRRDGETGRTASLIWME